MIDWKYAKKYLWSFRAWQRDMEEAGESSDREPAPEFILVATCATCALIYEFRNGDVACRKYEVNYENMEEAACRVCEHWYE